MQYIDWRVRVGVVKLVLFSISMYTVSKYLSTGAWEIQTQSPVFMQDRYFTHWGLCEVEQTLQHTSTRRVMNY